ncbi:MAG: glycosyltransferase family 4 protein [Planctomycetaceae bacterium]|nr:glycosyltransferase family 4 protein [Planctomycetaceae bacterium]
MPEVTFVALHALPAIDPTVPGVFGGTETRAWTFARALARLPGWKVNLAVRPRSPHSCYEGVRIQRVRKPLYDIFLHVGQCLAARQEFPFVTIKRWSWHLFWELPVCVASRPFLSRRGRSLGGVGQFSQLPGDLIVTFGVHVDSAKAIAGAHATGRPAVLMLGADSDLDERYATDPNYVSPYGNRSTDCLRALREADQIVVQTEQQQDLLLAHFHREGTFIANPIDEVVWDQQAEWPLPEELKDLENSGYVLWVGRADRFHKRALHCVELAEQLPDIPFVMLMNPRDPDVTREVHARRPPNLRIVEQVSFEQMSTLFRHARVYVNTSALGWEGFPNTFLQAAASRTPICSLEFGAEFLKEFDCGACAEGDFSRLVQVVQDCWLSPKSTMHVDASRRRVLAEFGAENQCQKLATVFDNALVQFTGGSLPEP